jgi:radical SAM-linked protein
MGKTQWARDMYRLRIKFSRGEEIKYISHLDMMRLWGRALRRSGIPFAYSEGFTPHPRISLASPLAIGVTSEAELMDVVLKKRVPPYFFIRTVHQQLPRGIDIFRVQEVALGAPSLQSQLRYVEYRVEVKENKNLREVQSAISSLLQVKHLPWQHLRDTGLHYYDLRALIENIWSVDWHDSSCILGMCLRCDSYGTGRPEQVTAALGFTHYPDSIHRTKLILAQKSADKSLGSSSTKLGI